MQSSKSLRQPADKIQNSFSFKILNQSNKSKARIGIFETPHGMIKTPAFVPCATKGSLKSLSSVEINDLGIQMLFVNTYHMVLSPGVDVIEKAGGIHNFSKINKPIITDSGGFQVFSLARSSVISSDEFATPGVASPHLVKITDDGVKFRSPIDGTEYYFTPEFSIEAQIKIGADFIVAFDECLPTGATRKQTERSVKRTHDWAKRSLNTFGRATALSTPGVEERSGKTPGVKLQQPYGVIQGGIYEDLRKQSAEFIASLPFWGLAIGGVSVGETKEEMRQQVSWAMKSIQKDNRPRHLLGVGEIDDILDMVKMGVDTFDCVIPTRHARMGKLYVNVNFQFSMINDQFKNHQIDIFNNIYKADLEPIDKNCSCYTCQNFTRAYLHHLFRQRELLGYRLATIHNLWVIETLFKSIRLAIKENRL